MRDIKPWEFGKSQIRDELRNTLDDNAAYWTLREKTDMASIIADEFLANLIIKAKGQGGKYE